MAQEPKLNFLLCFPGKQPLSPVIPGWWRGVVGVIEVEKNAFCNGTCERGGSVCCLSSSTSSCSSNSSSPTASSSTYLELWYACAGPLTSLPRKGNVVVYFPQGHLEQAASHSPLSAMEVPSFNLPPQIFCRVVNNQLLANKDNDEVYTQVTLLPQPELVGETLAGKELEELGMGDGGGGPPIRTTPHMFCKTLTASDTSTHGGFSVPRRAAEDCFPPLDYKQQRPSQELVTKDLHGVEWKFRHIYRGQPRRHLLTTGWSTFVSQKNLVSGDAVLFLRGENGELRLGIRRAVRPRSGLPDSIFGSQNAYPNVISSLAKAISTKSAFHVFCSPRASHSQFVIPYQKYVKSLINPVTVGTRFKMKFEMDDSPERRCSGVVSSIADVDPFRWPNSKWRCLMVRWDEDITSGHERVSPWEIDTSVSLPPLSVQTLPRMKKLRTSLPATLPTNPIPGGGVLDFEDSFRSSKVLQGQENVGFASSPFNRCITPNRSLEFERQSRAIQMKSPGEMGNGNIADFVKAHSIPYMGFKDTCRYPRVLQGQEIFSSKMLTKKAEFTGHLNISNSSSNMFQLHKLSSEGTQNVYIPRWEIYKHGQDSARLSYINDFSREVSFNSSTEAAGIRNDARRTVLPNLQEQMEVLIKSNDDNSNGDNSNGVATGCRLFGVSLTGETAANSQSSGKRSCTKVHKQGSLVGRAIDLAKLNGYADLLTELERLFGMEGLLNDPDKGWRTLYTDSENDVMVVGDDPWHEFCNEVAKIHIYTQEEVEKMTVGILSDDTQSSLEQAPPSTEPSKSSSVGQPDSSPTAERV